MQKLVRVSNGSDAWSLISLSNHCGKNVELKFVDRMRRQFEFSVDSFQVSLVVGFPLVVLRVASSSPAVGKSFDRG